MERYIMVYKQDYAVQQYIKENVAVNKLNLAKIDRWYNQEAVKFRKWADDYARQHSDSEQGYKDQLKYLIFQFQAKLMKMFGII